MPLTPEQAQRVSEADLAIRVGAEPADIAGAGYALYTARTAAEIRAWLTRGAPAGWDDRLYNTGLFIMAMPGVAARHLLFVPGGGGPSDESYSVAQLVGGRGRQETLPKVHRLANVAVEASMPLAGTNAEAIRQWVLEQI